MLSLSVRRELAIAMLNCTRGRGEGNGDGTVAKQKAY